MDHTPVLTQSEEERAPWHENYKVVEVTISQTLSSTQKVYISKDADETNIDILTDAVKDQILLPDENMEITGYPMWTVDDFCVAL